MGKKMGKTKLDFLIRAICARRGGARPGEGGSSAVHLVVSAEAELSRECAVEFCPALLTGSLDVVVLDRI